MSKERKTKDTIQSQESLYNLTHPTGKRGERLIEQDSFRVSRQYLLQANKVEGDILTGIAKSDDIRITGLTEVVSPLDLASLSLAIGKILHDQSHTSRNAKLNTGILSEQKAMTGDGKYQGGITTTLIDLCRDAYGEKEPTSNQKNKMRATLKAVDSTPIEITYPNGDRINSKLCVIMNEGIINSTKATYYHIIVNPIFCGELIKKNFGLYPSDVSYRLTEAIKKRKGAKKTPQHFWLMNYLTCQMDGVSISLDNLLSKLDLTKAYKTNRGRVEAQLESLFAVMKDIGLLRSDMDENPVVTTLKNGKGKKYKFYKNPNWSKPSSSNLLAP